MNAVVLVLDSSVWPLAQGDLKTPFMPRLPRIGADPIDELVHGNDIAIVFGAGVDFTDSRWGFEMRGSLGLTSVFESPWPNGQTLESSTKTRAFMLLVGYRF